MGNFHERIRVARRAAKLSQAALAAEIAVTPSAAAQWEHPQGTKPNIANLEAIAKVTGASFEWLVTGNGTRLPSRRHHQTSETPAVELDTFARDLDEEMLLKGFREMSPKRRTLLLSVAAELIQPRRRSG